MKINSLHRVVLETYDDGAHNRIAASDVLDLNEVSDPLLVYLLTIFSDEHSSDRQITSGDPTDPIVFALREMLGLLEALRQVRSALDHHEQAS